MPQRAFWAGGLSGAEWRLRSWPYIQPFIFPLVMKNLPACLLGVALLSLGLAVQAQTTPVAPSKAQPAKPLRHPSRPAAPKGEAYGGPFIKDTAAFRRSGRPADGPNRHPRK